MTRLISLEKEGKTQPDAMNVFDFTKAKFSVRLRKSTTFVWQASKNIRYEKIIGEIK